MKREARNHSKTKRLCRKLDIPLYQAMGILECLWHLTGSEAWRGDIGKLSNEDIALALDYRGSEDLLVGALVQCGWLDESTEFRLIVHDWHEHADDATDNRVARSIQTYATGQMPRMNRLRKDEREKLMQLFAESGIRAHRSAQTRTGSPKSALPVPEPLPEPVPVPEPVGESAPLAPLALDEECEIPNGLTPLQYADWVMEKAVIVSGFGLRDRFARTVSAICKLESVEGPEATRRLLQRVMTAQLAGETINTFWIDDSRWKSQARDAPHGAAAKRAAKVAEFMARGD